MTVLFAFVLLGLLGAQAPTDREIAAQLEGVLREQLHPAAVHVTVKRDSRLTTTLQRLDISISDFDVSRMLNAPANAGPAEAAQQPAPARERKQRLIRIVKTHVECDKARAGGLIMKKLTLDLDEARVPIAAAQAGALEIAKAKRAVCSLTLDTQGVTACVMSKNLPITDVAVALTPQGCSISGKTKMIIGVPVVVSGIVRARDGGVIYLDDPKMRVVGVPLPDMITDALLKGVNPLIDVNKEFTLPAPANIDAVTHLDGALRLDATMQFPKPE